MGDNFSEIFLGSQPSKDGVSETVSVIRDMLRWKEFPFWTLP
jgi:hypothetical protein